MKRRRMPRAARGQAMVEYSVVTWLLVIALVVLLNVPLPYTLAGSAKGGNNVIQIFLRIYQDYYDSFYLVLNSPFP